MNAAIDITAEQRKTLLALLRRFIPGVAVWAYGSRVKWTARPNSDLDLVAFATPVQRQRVSELKDALDESDLPFLVDLHVWDEVPEKFREIIHKEYVVLQDAGQLESSSGREGEWPTATVLELQRDGVLLVEDGNHGEHRPRPNEFVDAGVAFIRAADMDSGRVLFESAARINEKARARITKGIGECGDVLLSHKGTVGKVALVADDAPPFVCSPQTTFWRTLDQKRLDRKYLYAFLRSPGFHAQLATRAGETDMAPYVSLTSQRGLSVTVPPIGTQRAIAHILGTLDDKIELNRRMNETLEAMARALFKSWFVDFDPVRAKAEGRDPGLPQPLADLFPDSFEDSELGEIPKGWECSTVGKHFKLTMGQSPPGSTYNETGDGLPFFQGRTDFGFRFPSRRIFCTAPTRLADAGDTLVSVRAPVGDVNIAIEPCAVGRGVAAVRHLSGSCSFTYHAMHNLGEHFNKFEAEGTVFGSINKADFGRLPFVAPPPAVLASFEQLVSSIDAQVESNERESRTLAALRDTLLPKLISGEVRLKTSEQIVAEVTV